MTAESRESPATKVLGLPPKITQGPEIPEMATPYEKPASLSLAVWPSRVVGVNVASRFGRVSLGQSSKYYEEALQGRGGRLASGKQAPVSSRSTTIITTSTGNFHSTSSSTNTGTSPQLATTPIPPLRSSQSSNDIDMFVGISVTVVCISILPCIWCACHWARSIKLHMMDMRSRRRIVPEGPNDIIPADIKGDRGDVKVAIYMPQTPEAQERGEETQTSNKSLLNAAFGILPVSLVANDGEVARYSSGLKHELDDLEGNVEEVQTSQSSLVRSPPRPNSTNLSRFNDLEGDTEEVQTSQGSFARRQPRPKSETLPRLDHLEGDIAEVQTSQSSLAPWPPRPNSKDLSRLDDLEGNVEEVQTSQSSLVPCPPTPNIEDLPKLQLKDDSREVLLGEPDGSCSFSLYMPCQTPTGVSASAEPSSVHRSFSMSSTQGRLQAWPTEALAEECDEDVIEVERERRIRMRMHTTFRW